MLDFRSASLFLLVPLFAATPNAAFAEALNVDQCVEIALLRSPEIEQAEAKVSEYEARLARVESIFYPKLTGIAFVAPMFTIDAIRQNGAIAGYSRSYKKIGDWGPYTFLEAMLTQPLYTFGRVAAGKESARERAAVEKARVREAELVVAQEVRKLYYLHLFARSMIPSLKNAAKIVTKAQAQGLEMFDSGSGDVTQADLAKLDFASAEVAKFLIQAKNGSEVALSALKHTMGLAEIEELELSDQKLPGLRNNDPDDLRTLLAEAAVKRPEWAQLEHGMKAAKALEKAKKLANTPVFGLGAQFRYAWTPTRDDVGNPYYRDTYNDIFAGVALGLTFNIDPALASANAEEARAIQEQLEALNRFAATGIPLRVRKAYQEMNSFREMTLLSKRGVKAARKWMFFSATAYGTGTGEAKDLLEGVVAYLQAKKGEYDSLHGYHRAHAELDFAVGRLE